MAWTCINCETINERSDSICEVCGLEKSGSKELIRSLKNLPLAAESSADTTFEPVWMAHEGEISPWPEGAIPPLIKYFYHGWFWNKIIESEFPAIASKKFEKMGVKSVGEGHKTPIVSLSFTPNSKTIITVDSKRKVGIWEEKKGLVSSDFWQWTKGPIPLATQFGKVLGRGGKKIAIWTFKKLLVNPFSTNQKDKIVHIVLLEGGKMVIALTYQNEISNWEKVDFEPLLEVIHTSTLPLSKANILTGHPKLQRFAVGTKEGEVFEFGFHFNDLTEKIIAEITFEVSSLAYSPSGDYLVSGTHSGRIFVWDAKTCNQLGSFETEEKEEILAIAFFKNEELIITGDKSGNVKAWNWRTGKVLRSFSSALTRVNAIAVSPKGKTLAAAGNPSTLAVWDLKKEFS